jgi:N-methylhydantoinase B/oxoprolinase/acetone carboxylase alpha subunit
LDDRPQPGKVSLQLERGQRLCIESAGGGGWGEA